MAETNPRIMSLVDCMVSSQGESVTVEKTTVEIEDENGNFDFELSTQTNTTQLMFIMDFIDNPLYRSDSGFDYGDNLDTLFKSTSDINIRTGGYKPDIVIRSNGDRLEVVRVQEHTVLGLTYKRVWLKFLQGGIRG